MLKLATVFSGIGSIEHALERLGIPYQCVFACDNGNVSPLSKKNFLYTIKDIEEQISQNNKSLQLLSNNGTESSILEDIQIHLHKIELIKEDLILKSKSLLELKILDSIEFNSLKEYSKQFPIDINTPSYEYIFIMNLIKVKKNIVNNKWELIFKNKETKAIITLLKEINEQLFMLSEKLFTQDILYKLKDMETFKEKKSFIDSLYNVKSKSNYVKKSYMENYDISDSDFHWDVKFLDGNHYRNQVDLFVGGSPCQSFSMVGKRRGLEDTRGTLFYEFGRLVKEIQPKVFIYENVKAILSNDEGRTWDTMTQVFDELNYKWKYAILNAKDYGVPQNRERVFVVGIRNDLSLADEFQFPPKVQLTKKMKDYLLDNVSGKYYLNNKGVKFVTSDKNINKRYTQINGDIQLCQKANQQFNWHGDFVFVEENNDMYKTMEDLEKYFLSEKVRKYVLASGTKNFYSKPEIDLDIARPLLTTMHKMHRAGVDNYVTTEGRIRKLAPRECLRLMGFCDSFKIVVSDTQMYQQAGNSIVVDVLMALVKQIIIALPEIVSDFETDSDKISENYIQQVMSF